ncbi:MAG: ABC transporter permease [bacterium]
MGAVVNLALKDLRLLWRDRFGLFWVLAFPLLMALFFGSIFGSGGGGAAAMKVAVVDQDQSRFSQLLIDHLDSSSALRVIRTSPDSARSLVRRGKAVAYMIIKPGAGEPANLFSPDSATIVAGMDPSRRAEAGYLQGLLMESWFAVMQHTLLQPGSARSYIGDILQGLPTDTSLTADQSHVLGSFLTNLHDFLGEVDTGALAGPVGTDSSASGGGSSFMAGPKIEIESVTVDSDRPRSSWEITFPQAILWALIGCSAAFAISLVIERTRGTLLRLRLAPIRRWQVLAGKGLACFIFCIAVCSLLLGLAKLVFGIRTPEPLLLAAAVVAAAFCFVGLMMLISVLGRTEQAVGGAGWAVLLVFSMTGGGMVPLVALPSWMVTISHFSPVKWGIIAFEGAIWRGFGAAEMMLPLGILIGIGLATFTAGVLIMRRTGD